MKSVAPFPYSNIARIYDDIMRDVDYENWADYIDEIIQFHHPDAYNLLELACGTGSHAFKLDELDCYRIHATDISPEMIKIALQKAARLNAEVTFGVADFLSFSINQTFDAAFLLFDSINYVHDPQELSGLFKCVEAHLNPNGIFIFDMTTPAFSKRIEHTLNENSRRTGNIRYTRMSNWNPDERMHTNHFIIETLDEQTGRVLETEEEVHQQKIHRLDEIENAIATSGLKIESRYSDFDFKPVHDETDRITVVLRKCQTSQ